MRARRRSSRRLCSGPERNQPVFDGPKSVMRKPPAGYPLRSRNERSVGTTFHAPVDRYMIGACVPSGTPSDEAEDIVSVVSSSAMPGTASREETRSRNACLAAVTSRGSIDTMTVSSMSETTPKCSSSDTMRTRTQAGRPARIRPLRGRSYIAEGGAGSGVAVRRVVASLAAVSSDMPSARTSPACRTWMVALCQPGSRPWPSTVMSTNPPRSAKASRRALPTVTSTG